jgi:putative heme-binding domain-containing protein
MNVKRTTSKPTHGLFFICSVMLGLNFVPAHAEILTLHTRSCQETAKGSGEWRTTETTVHWDARKTAIVICDMWNQHWCKGATARVAEMAPRMNEVIKAARSRGVLIIHCPSDTMKYYANYPQRKLAQAAPKVPLKHVGGLDRPPEGPLPIDDSDGGCDDVPQCKQGGPWTHEIDTLQIADGDAITDSAEAYYLMKQRGIENVIVMGVHGNMCVLGRAFAIRQMVSLGQNVVFMRDMIDTMYNSRKAPYVSHFAGTDLVVEHIEKYWCPSITSADFLGGEPFHFQADKRPRIVFVIGENEYHTWESLPEFARNELDWRGYQCSFVTASTDTKDNVFTNYNVIKDADLLFLSVRRRTPPKEMMALIRAHLEAGKPLIGIRTACHAFGAKPVDAQHEGWPSFDVDVLGCNYQGHYSNSGPNGAPSYVRIIPGASPILTGLPTNELEVQGSLYKSRNPAPTVTPLMTGRLASGSEIEPVAWINTAHNRRVFYTSLGTPDNFKQPFFRELLLNGIAWALDRPIPPMLVSRPGGALASEPAKPQTRPATASQKVQAHPMTPAQSQAAFKIADDLEIDQVLTEPQVRQPVFMNFDERGRLWVVEYLQYPHPAGLKMLSRDSVWRAVYDKVPPPPPHQFVGADKICIFEDTHGDGVFDREKVFADGLNIVTAVTKGRGGVWVLNPPYLLFYPDKNNDDIPDGDPQVMLSGFGLEDTHSVVNSLRWGPDGWLYGCQGSTVSAHVIRPGLDREPISNTEGQLIWRYHPETKRFEVFAEGGGNAFGCEIDAQGRIFSGHNGGDTRGFHYMQGAYLQKGFAKHGPLSNPYAFGYFPPMPHPPVERFTHNFIVYDGGALPDHYNGKLFGIEPLQGRVVESVIDPDGSTFKTYDVGHPVTTSDQWFRPVDIKVGPDGAIYIADWYDQQVNHYRNSEGHIDKSNGRIYRLKAKGAKPIKPFDLGKLSTQELVDELGNSNKWFRREALQLIGDRKDASVVPRLRNMVETKTGQLALEAFWALNLSGGLDNAMALKTLDHPDPFVRLWTVRLLGDERKVSPAVAQKLVALAAGEPNVEVRAQLACSAKRLPAADALPIIKALLGRNEDVADKRIPLLLWWALESKCEQDRDAVIELFSDPAVWRLPLVQSTILERVMRRYATPGTRPDLLTCAQLLQLSPGPEQTAKLMSGFEQAFKGRSLATLPDELLGAMAKSGYKSVELGLRRGDAEAVNEAIRQIRDPAVETEKRREYIEIFGEVKQAKILPVLLDLIADPKASALQKAVLTALQQFDDPAIAGKVMSRLNVLDDQARPAALELLSSRPGWTEELLDAVDAGKISKSSIPQDVLRKIKTYPEKAIVESVKRHWGGERVATTAEMQVKIKHYAAAIQIGTGDPYAGRALFTGRCAVCHTLFGQGGQIGPNLTVYKRDDLDTMLLSIVNPSAEIREGFENYIVTTKDGRTLSGFLADKDNQVVVLRGLDGVNQVLPQNQIADMKSTGVSLMPEGLLDSLDDQKVRDLFAYLRSSQPLVGSPPPRLSASNK